MDLTSDLTERSSQRDDGHELTEHAVTGVLADRIRRRLNAPATATVTLVEEVHEWGTEWTREHSTEFTVRAGSESRRFWPDSSQADWVLDQAATTVHDSVYARFDAWLQVAERPAELVREWFEYIESWERWDRWNVRPDSILGRVLRHRHLRADHFSLERVPEPAATDRESRATFDDVDFARWRLNAVAAPDDHGFAAIIRRYTLAEHTLSTEGPVIVPGVLVDLSDLLFVGEEH